MLLDRAFQSTLHKHLEPLLPTLLTTLTTLYPHYHTALTSPTVPADLIKLLIPLLDSLQIVLRAPAFNPPEKDFQQRALDHLVFETLVKYAALSDEVVADWLENPMSLIDESAEVLLRLAVRHMVLACAEEHLDLSFTIIWSQYYNSVVGEYPSLPLECVVDVGKLASGGGCFCAHADTRLGRGFRRIHPILENHGLCSPSYRIK